MAPGARPGLSFPSAVIREEPRGSSSKVLQDFEQLFMLITDLKGLYNCQAPQKRACNQLHACTGRLHVHMGCMANLAKGCTCYTPRESFTHQFSCNSWPLTSCICNQSQITRQVLVFLVTKTKAGPRSRRCEKFTSPSKNM